MKVLDYLDNVIANNLLLKQVDDKRHRDLEQHLSGSILGHPLQEQILHIIGVPQKQIDHYVLRKFERGHHVEDWVMKQLMGVLSPEEMKKFAKERGIDIQIDHQGQAGIHYRSAKGHLDALVDMSAWEEPELGIIPHEVKSITNANWNRKFGPKCFGNPLNNASNAHKYQAGMYAMALQCDHFLIHYVASDDYRIKSLLFRTEDVREEIDNIITEVEEQLATGTIPEFEPREEWQAKYPEYNNYPMWMGLTQKEVMEKLKKEYPDCYRKLKSYTKKGGE